MIKIETVTATLETLKQVRTQVEGEMQKYNQIRGDPLAHFKFYQLGGLMVKLNKLIDNLATEIYGEDALEHN